jgi:hypothetical protein
MNTRLLILLAFLPVGPALFADVVTDWNESALQAIRTDKTPPPKAARALAILHAAIFDAVNGIAQTHERYLVTGKPSGAASAEAAASSAAHLALVRLFPALQPRFDESYKKSLAAIPNSAEKNSGIHWGEWAANLVVVARSVDGNDQAAAYAAKSAPGQWQPTPPALAPPLLPQWPKLACFAMTDPTQFRPMRPPGLTSAMYAFDVNLTKQLGGRDSTARTMEQTAIAQFWADGPGTVTPPGHWNVIARDVATKRGNTMEQNARLFALLNIALADAGICCWDCKYEVNLWRPITAIQNADTDNNPATEKDPAWTPLLETPPFPEYTSGHSTFSSAAATVLALFFGSDEIPFATGSEALPGFSRNYNSFSEAAAEAGMSRIFGGIHFMTANREGLASGARLGTYVVENVLKAKEKRPAALAQSTPASSNEQGPSVSPAHFVPPQSIGLNASPMVPSATGISTAQPSAARPLASPPSIATPAASVAAATSTTVSSPAPRSKPVIIPSHAAARNPSAGSSANSPDRPAPIASIPPGGSARNQPIQSADPGAPLPPFPAAISATDLDRSHSDKIIIRRAEVPARAVSQPSSAN